MTDAAAVERRRVLFVTGRLAEPALRRVLADMSPGFAYDVAPLGITVAALMTTEWIAGRLPAPAGADLVLIPGLCEGDCRVIADRVGVHVEKGPKDLREIPEYFGRAAAKHEYGARRGPHDAVVAEDDTVDASFGHGRFLPFLMVCCSGGGTAVGTGLVDCGVQPQDRPSTRSTGNSRSSGGSQGLSR